MLFGLGMWPGSFKMSGQVTQVKKAALQNKYDVKEREKLELFQKVNLTQDSILKLLKQQPHRKPSAIKYVKVYRFVPITVVDTLRVKNDVIVTPHDELPDNYYLMPDTAVEKKKKPTFFQRLFHHKKFVNN